MEIQSFSEAKKATRPRLGRKDAFASVCVLPAAMHSAKALHFMTIKPHF